MLAHPPGIPRMQVFLLQLTLVPCIPDVTRALFMPEHQCLRKHTVIPHHILCLQFFWRRDSKTFAKSSDAHDLKNSRTVWSVTPACRDLCLSDSQLVTVQPLQGGGGWGCKQPKKLASPFISRFFFFLTFVFIFESDTHYSKLLKGVRTFPPRRKWNWYAK